MRSIFLVHTITLITEFPYFLYNQQETILQSKTKPVTILLEFILLYRKLARACLCIQYKPKFLVM